MAHRRRGLALALVMVLGVGIGILFGTHSGPRGTDRSQRVSAGGETIGRAAQVEPVPPAPSTSATTVVFPSSTTTTTPLLPLAATPATATARGNEALGMIRYSWQRFGFTLQFLDGRPGLLGKTDCGKKEMTVYVRNGQPTRQIAFVTAFEIAHAVDCASMSPQRRQEWADLRGFRSGWTWFPSCLCSEDGYGSGDFAMVFANWLVPDGGIGWRSKLAGPPSAIEPLLPYLEPGG
jgi:hypothetical protein